MSESVENTSGKSELPGAEKKPKKSTPPFGAVFSSVGLFFLEILAPAFLAAVIVGVLFSSLNGWQLNRILALVIFGLGMVIFGAVAMLTVDTLTASARKKNVRLNATFGSGPRMRLVEYVLGGVVIPLALYLVAVFVPLSNGQTAMSLFISSPLVQAPSTPPARIGALVLESPDPDTRLLGIQALQSLRSPEALAQLVRVVNEKPEILNDPILYHTLSTAIGSYGADAKQPLLEMFKNAKPFEGPINVDADRYARYFEAGFASLRSDMSAGSELSADQLAQIDAAEAQLKTTLQNVHVQPVPSSGDLRQEFVLQAFLDSSLKEDGDLLTLAKSISGDKTYPARVRGQAMLLVAKLGSSADLNVFYNLLQSEDEALQTRALEAIAALQAKTTKK